MDLLEYGMCLQEEILQLISLQQEGGYRLLEFFHAKESAEEYPYTIYMKAITLFQSESEHTDFLRYVQTHIGRYKELYAQQDDSELPPISDREGYNMEVFRKEYRDALVIQKMLSEFRRHGSGLW